MRGVFRAQALAQPDTWALLLCCATLFCCLLLHFCPLLILFEDVFLASWRNICSRAYIIHPSSFVSRAATTAAGVNLDSLVYSPHCSGPRVRKHRSTLP